MSKYIVEIKGLFDTLYLEGGAYNKYQATVKDKSKAKQFNTLAEAQKQAKSVKGRTNIIEIVEESSQPIYDLIHCESCSYYDGVVCRRTKLPSDRMDYCSRGFAKKNSNN